MLNVCKQTNKNFKVRQPQRAARSKRPNTPSDGSKNNGCHTTNQEEYPSIHPTTETANSAQKTNPSQGGSRWFQSKYNAEHQPSKMSGEDVRQDVRRRCPARCPAKMSGKMSGTNQARCRSLGTVRCYELTLRSPSPCHPFKGTCYLAPEHGCSAAYSTTIIPILYVVISCVGIGPCQASLSCF